MNFDEFTGQVQHRLQLADSGEAVRAIRATLTTLGQRLEAGQASDLAGALPMEIDWYLTGAVAEHGQRFDWEAFVTRVADIEETDPSEAAHHARVVIDLVNEAVPSSELEHVRDQLPEGEEDWDELFELIDAGGWEEVQPAQTDGGVQTNH